MDPLIPIRFRHENELPIEADFAFMWPVSQVDDLIPLVEQWGVHDTDESHHEAFGQFVRARGKVWFEVGYA